MVWYSVGEMVFALGETERVPDETSPWPTAAAAVSIGATASASSVSASVFQSSPAATRGIISFRRLPGFVGEQQLVRVSE